MTRGTKVTQGRGSWSPEATEQIWNGRSLHSEAPVEKMYVFWFRLGKKKNVQIWASNSKIETVLLEYIKYRNRNLFATIRITALYDFINISTFLHKKQNTCNQLPSYPMNPVHLRIHYPSDFIIYPCRYIPRNRTFVEALLSSTGPTRTPKHRHNS